MYVGVLPACISMHHMHLVFVEVREGIGSPGTGIGESYEPPCRCWKLHRNLTVLQPQFPFFICESRMGAL